MRSRLIPAAVAVLLSGAVLAGCSADDSDEPQVPDTTTSDAPDADAGPDESETPSESITVGVPADASDQRCVAPSADSLSAVADQAFEGVAESVVDDTVTLTPTTWYLGDEVAEVNVEAPSPELQQVLLTVDFVEGERYLVATAEGNLVLCGMTDAWSAELEEAYVEAFSS